MRITKKERQKHDAWYAAIAMVIVAAGFLFAGYWLGLLNTNLIVIQPQLIKPSVSQQQNSTTALKQDIPYYSDVSMWQADHFDVSKMTISYPIDFPTDKNFPKTQTTEWRANGLGGPGLKVFTLTIPKSFIPHSNFSEATLTVGRSSNNVAMVNCLKPDEDSGPNSVGRTEIINGQTFSVYESADAGAGNMYNTTSYRTERAGQCYAIEYTIHTTQLGNYPDQYKLVEADTTQVKDLLDRMVHTVTFDQ